MPRADKDRVLELVEEAQQLERGERTAFVRAACGDDDALRDEVEELLSFDDEEDDDPLGALAGGAARFIDSFKEQIKDATRRAEAQLTHEALFDELMTGLRQHGVTAQRYRIGRVLGRGGMGEVHEAWDLDLRRRVALKRIRRSACDGTRSGTLPVGAGMQIRFLQEAQITAQLDHPCVLSIHELGVDDEGRLFFTMPLIEGESLATVLAGDDDDGLPAWKQRPVMDALLRAAQAIAHAHERGVVHRDLKPANIMLGRHGAVHLMDWGIARVVDEERAHELFFGLDADPELAAELRSGSIDAAFQTVAGSAVGTPSYMPPEQAAGDIEALGPAADVYSVGAILYEVLGGSAPYTDRPGPDGERPSTHEVLERVRAGPPTPITDIAPEAPPELVAICERAMRRRPARRFSSAQLFVNDLSAYLDGRVVESYEQGVLPELRKWIGRNRTLAATLLLALASLFAGTVGVLTLRSQRADDALRAADELRMQVDDFSRLAAMQDAERLQRTAADLWPVSADMLGPLREWRSEAHALLATLPEFEVQLAQLRREKGVPRSAESRALLSLQHPLRAEYLRKTETQRLLEARAEELRAQLAESIENDNERASSAIVGTLADVERELRGLPPVIDKLAEEIRLDVELDFVDPQDAWWERQLRNYVSTMREFGDPLHGPLHGLSREYGPGIERRIVQARDMREREASLAFHADWQIVLDDLASDPAFDGLRIAPMADLLPLRRDTRSGLWEFLHVNSGVAPQLDPHLDAWRIERETGIVVILVPGGEYVIGAQRLDESEPNYCHFAREREQPLSTVQLAPYLLSKYELTQAQFARLGGWDPSRISHPDGVHPVENPTWEQSLQVLARFDLTLPTEAQWETAGRAGTQSPFWCGDHTLDLIGSEVLSFARIGARSELREAYLAMFGARDYPSYPTTQRVDLLRANPWGFYHMIGNVEEWCLDLYDTYDAPTAPDTGERVAVRDDRRLRLFRGGCYARIPVNGRVSRREARPQDSHANVRGLRPARLADLVE